VPINYSAYTSIANATTLLDPAAEAHCELYLSSILGMGAYANGASVISHTDNSGNARHAVSLGGFTQPVFSTVDLTPLGKPTVKWAGVLDALANASAFTWPTIATRGYTFYHYCRTEAKSAPPYDFVNQVFFSRGSTAGLSLVAHSGGGAGKYGFVDDAGGGAPKVFGTHASIADQYHLHTIVLPSPNNGTVPVRYYLDGVLQTQTSGGTNYQSSLVGTDTYILGQGTSGNVTFKGKAGFLIWYSDTHAQAKIDQFTAWTAAVFGF
jgi:hypothetical protein